MIYIEILIILKKTNKKTFINRNYKEQKNYKKQEYIEMNIDIENSTIMARDLRFKSMILRNYLTD